MRRSRKPWPIKMVVWLCVAQGYNDGQIANGIGLNPQQLAEAPRTRDTVRIIREEFYELDRPKLVQAIHEEPRLMMLLRDEQILCLMVRAFCRAAFDTHIAEEHSVPDFIQAIEDTIDVLNTGDVRARDGRMLEHIPTLYDLKDGSSKAVIQRILGKLNGLRTMCDNGLKDGSIKELNIGWMIAPGVAASMEALRDDILADFEGIYPKFGVERIALRLSDST